MFEISTTSDVLEECHELQAELVRSGDEWELILKAPGLTSAKARQALAAVLSQFGTGENSAGVLVLTNRSFLSVDTLLGVKFSIGGLPVEDSSAPQEGSSQVEPSKSLE